MPNADRLAAAGARAVGQGVVVGAITLGVLAGLLLVAGLPVGAALAALWRGAFGSTDAILSSTLVRAIPLLLIGSGMVIALRAGVINLGGDGQLLAGAVVATAVALGADRWGVFAVTLALIGAAGGGASWAVLPAWLKSRFGTLEVVSTIMMNFLALYVVSYLVRGPLQEPTGIYPQSASIAVAAQLPPLMAGTRLHAGVGLAVLAVVASWLLLEHSAAGFRMRAVGSNPRAAELAGRIDVGRVQRGAFLTSGALAGLAGGIEVLGVTYALYENLSPGCGYSAIAVALLARLGPLRVVVSALLLGGLAAGATAMQRDAGIPAGAAATVEATLILVILAGQALLLRRAGAERTAAP